MGAIEERTEIDERELRWLKKQLAAGNMEAYNAEFAQLIVKYNAIDIDTDTGAILRNG